MPNNGHPAPGINNPAPYGPNPKEGYHMRKSILTVHARRMKHDLRESVKNLKRSMKRQEVVVGADANRPEDGLQWHEPAEGWQSLTRDQLREAAKERGHRGYGKMNKADLVRLVTS